MKENKCSIRGYLLEYLNNRNDTELEKFRKIIQGMINKPQIDSSLLNSSTLIMGTGGNSLFSGCVSSLAAITVSSQGYKIIKTGSKSYHGKVSSFDCFSILGFNENNRVDWLNEYLYHNHICYIYSPSVFKWLDDYNFIQMNLTDYEIKYLFDNLGNEVNCRNAIIGCTNVNLFEFYESLTANQYDKVCVYTGSTKNILYDEISLWCKSKALCVSNDSIDEHIISNKDFGINKYEAKQFEYCDLRQAKEDITNYLFAKECIVSPIKQLIIANAAFYICTINKDWTNIKHVYNEISYKYTQGEIKEYVISLMKMNK